MTTLQETGPTSFCPRFLGVIVLLCGLVICGGQDNSYFLNRLLLSAQPWPAFCRPSAGLLQASVHIYSTSSRQRKLHNGARQHLVSTSECKDGKSQTNKHKTGKTQTRIGDADPVLACVLEEAATIAVRKTLWKAIGWLLLEGGGRHHWGRDWGKEYPAGTARQRTSELAPRRRPVSTDFQSESTGVDVETISQPEQHPWRQSPLCEASHLAFFFLDL